MRLCDESLYAVICVYVTNVMNVSLVITLECPVLGRVVNKTVLYYLLVWFSFPKSTAGMPSKGLSNILNCSVT